MLVLEPPATECALSTEKLAKIKDTNYREQNTTSDQSEALPETMHSYGGSHCFFN